MIRLNKGGVTFKMNYYPEYNQTTMTSYELYHYGIKRRSGRYPYGSGEDPYQGESKAKRRSLLGLLPSRKKEELKMEDRKVLRKGGIRKEDTDEQTLKANKSRILQSGSATEVLKYRGKLTNAELKQVTERLNMEQKLMDASKKEIQSNMQKIDDYMKTLKTFNEWASVGTDTYNTIVSIYNATPEGKKKPLTQIEKQQSQQGKKKK